MSGIIRIAFVFVAVTSAGFLQAQTNDPIAGRVENLVSHLQNADAGEQLEVVSELGELGPLAKPAVPVLIKTLGAGDDLALKHEVLITLGRIGVEAGEAVPEIRKYLKHESPVLQHAAIHSLAKVGRKAKDSLPQLIELARTSNPVIAVSAARALVAISGDEQTQADALAVLVRGLESEDPAVLSDAVEGLVELGKPAVPALVSRLRKDDKAAILAADTLAMLGLEAEVGIPGLLSALESQSEDIAAHAARALGVIGVQPGTVVPALATHLNARSATIRMASATAIGRFGKSGAPAVPALTSALFDPNVEVRVASAAALGAIGPDAKSAVPALNRALDDSAGIVTLSAAEALGSIKGPAVEVLAARLDQPAFLPLAAAILGHMRSDAAAATPALVRHLDTQEPESQMEVLLAIGGIGPKAANVATKPLLNLARTVEGRPKQGVVYALAKMGAKEAIPLFREGVKQNKDELLQRTCAWALVTLDPENAEYVEQALPALTAGLSDKLPLVRKECAIAIQKIGPEARAAVPELLTALESSDPEVQTEILDALAEIGPEARAAVPAAVKLLESPNPYVRYTAIYLLGKLGQASKEATPAIEKVLETRDPFAPTVAAWALVNIDPNPTNVRRAIPLMLNALEHENPQVRVKAAEILGKIGRDQRDVETALQKTTGDKDETVRQGAKKALTLPK